MKVNKTGYFEVRQGSRVRAGYGIRHAAQVARDMVREYGTAADVFQYGAGIVRTYSFNRSNRIVIVAGK